MTKDYPYPTEKKAREIEDKLRKLERMEKIKSLWKEWKKFNRSEI